MGLQPNPQRFGLPKVRSVKALKEPISENGEVFRLLFRNHKTVHASRLLFKWMLDRGGYATPKQLSSFAWKLQRGVAEKGFSYRRSSLYRTVLRRLLDFGFVNQQQIYDKETGKIVQAYVLVKQPIPKRAPLGGVSFWKLAWHICKAWNEHLEKAKG
ncbi:MAG: hypothetical protein QW175_05850 [Candidatus Bathyarchaeia archaeon]